MEVIQVDCCFQAEPVRRVLAVFLQFLRAPQYLLCGKYWCSPRRDRTQDVPRRAPRGAEEFSRARGLAVQARRDGSHSSGLLF